MTKSEITKKSNSYKNQLNICTQQIDNYDQTIGSFSKFKKYLTKSYLRAKKYKKYALTYACLGIILTLLCSFVSLPVALVLLIIPTIAFQRFVFFKKVAKKFAHCVNYLSKTISNLTTKQFDYVSQRNIALKEIIKLENEIPDVMINHLEDNKYINIEENLDSLSL